MSVLMSPFAAERGSDLALADDVGELTFAELDRCINQMIHAMRDAGLGAGDTIAVVAGNSNEWFASFNQRCGCHLVDERDSTITNN